ncbi:hypothetical protein HCJ93_11100 [Streptomyces sp. SBST2-5]|uniref:Serine/arginine repetitive matrix protein 2 n=1 Tax=Streptomyces composti TaxID=2720025 RepID=A0ABX1A5C6_9ACTN|nr:hypothetical protein [Streptomyces composti]NJP50601.1 hypothetical protein [Streptomyces composti]
MGTGTGPLYWNEENQRWEDAGGATAGTGADTGAEGPTPQDPAPAAEDRSAGAGAAGPVQWPPAAGEPASADDGGGTAGAGEGGDPAASGAEAESGSGSGGDPAGSGGVGSARSRDEQPSAGTAPAPSAPPGPAPAGLPDPAHYAPTLTGIQRPGAAAAPPPPPAPTPPPWQVSGVSLGTGQVPGVPEPVRPGRNTGRIWGVVGGAAAVGVIVGLVVTLVVKNGDGTKDGAGGGHASVAATASRTPGAAGEGGQQDSGGEQPPPGSPSASSSVLDSGERDRELPTGYESYADPEGFTIARPTGWTRTTVPSKHGFDVVNYRSPGGDRRIQVFEVLEPSPQSSHEEFLSARVAKAPGFTELSREDLNDGDVTGSRLEYLADSFKGEPDVGTWHVVDQRFEAADGKVYAVAVYGADADGREDERELLRTALSAFCPPYTTCG